jgi:hypothetical protein
MDYLRLARRASFAGSVLALPLALLGGCAAPEDEANVDDSSAAASASAFEVGEYWTGTASPIARLTVDKVEGTRVSLRYVTNNPWSANPKVFVRRQGLNGVIDRNDPAKIVLQEEMSGDPCAYRLERLPNRSLVLRRHFSGSVSEASCDLIPDGVAEVTLPPHADKAELTSINADETIFATRKEATSDRYLGVFVTKEVVKSTVFVVERPTTRIKTPDCELTVTIATAAVDVTQKGSCLSLLATAPPPGMLSAQLAGHYPL